MRKRARKAAADAERKRVSARDAPILELIERAFDGVPLPDADHLTLHQAEAWDSYERVDQRKDHRGRWQDLPDAHLDACSNALAHLDEQGIPYYLPAIMSHFLRHRGEGSWLHESLLYALEPSGGGLRDYQRRRFGRLTHAQRAAVLVFLEHVEVEEKVLDSWRRVVEGGDDREWFQRFR